jgi:hypothetical protein
MMRDSIWWLCKKLFPILQLTPEYDCVNFTVRSHFPVSKMSPYLSFELRDWFAPGMFLWARRQVKNPKSKKTKSSENPKGRDFKK